MSFLGGIHEYVIQFVFFVLMLAATEAGFRLGRRFEKTTLPETKLQITIVEAALLGVLALLLGFTMSMAVSRFEARKQLILDEANAISTSYLRAQLLPAPDGPEIMELLRQYMNVRVQYGISGDGLAPLNDLRTQTTELQKQIWTRAVAYARKDPSPVKSGLLLQSLNEAIDLETARWTAFQNHVPPNVMYVNAVVALLATMLVGYAFGVHGRREYFSMFVIVFGITLVFAVIVDLDRPRTGFIRANQQPMIDLRQP